MQTVINVASVACRCATNEASVARRIFDSVRRRVCANANTGRYERPPTPPHPTPPHPTPPHPTPPHPTPPHPTPWCQRRPELEDIGCIQGKITAKPFISWKNDSKTISVPWILYKSIRFPIDSLSRTNPKFCQRALTGRHLREKLQRVGAVVLWNEPQQGRRSLGETSSESAISREIWRKPCFYSIVLISSDI